MKQAYKAEFNTRLLYHQKYSTEDCVHVASSMYAIMWGLNSTPLTTTRIRLTSLYNISGSCVQPIQGLIEQWKNDGWVVIDEFVDITREFDSQKEYESYLMKMARSFLLGIPIESDIVSGDDPIPKGTKLNIPDLHSRLDKLIKKDNKIPEVFKDQQAQPADKEDTFSKLKDEKKDAEPIVKEEELDTQTVDDDESDDDWV